MTTVDVVIPVYNEERDLPRNVPVLHRFLSSEGFPYRWRIVIADNASTDATPQVAHRLARELPGVDYLRIERKGRGIALKTAWGQSQADVVSYMDVDLSTDIAAFPALVRAVAEEGFHLATGTRLARGAQVRRSLKRETLSRGYMLLLKLSLGVRFSDAQCGFKAARADAFRALLPLLRNDNWFFDTELLVIAERAGYRIAEVPVRWQEDHDSRVKVVRTAVEDVRGILRLLRERPWRLAPPPGTF
ncbi:MAG: glycosyltransferase family 2 protein [Dehalococcoidia bacterium]|jgi:glycosyltransferase involved in cell wall biosynthesis|nr:glycosyltransferase family 2 protein [Dehalococcoidia bacterium]MDW8009010.1 glycosyltransferase family 2 protein [Chloroflexota bacterium]